MSFSFSVESTPTADFGTAAQASLDKLNAEAEVNDYMLDQLATGLADAGIAAVKKILDDGNLGEGNVIASISGHRGSDGSPSSLGVSVQVTPDAASTPTAATDGTAAPTSPAPTGVQTNTPDANTDTTAVPTPGDQPVVADPAPVTTADPGTSTNADPAAPTASAPGDGWTA